MSTPRHPAKFNDAIMEVVASVLPPEQYPKVLDPLAGTGRIHELPQDTTGIEIEAEWAAMHPGTVHGDCLEVMAAFAGESFDAIATSPAYGNRMADDHTPSEEDVSVRNTYRHALGRALTDGTSANLQWGPAYREWHERCWAACMRVLRTHGLFVLNVKDHVRAGRVQPVSGWHVTTLCRLGLRLVDYRPIPARGNRMGANGAARVENEWVFVFVKDQVPPDELTHPDDGAEVARLERRVRELEAELALERLARRSFQVGGAPEGGCDDREPVRVQQPEEALVRGSDPATSRKAAHTAATSWRTASQNVSMLIAWYENARRGGDGLTSEEAAVLTGMASVPRCCWWHRASDNKKTGTIAPTGKERPGASRHDREVLRITQFGMEVAEAHVRNGAGLTTWKRS